MTPHYTSKGYSLCKSNFLFPAKIGIGESKHHNAKSKVESTNISSSLEAQSSV